MSEYHNEYAKKSTEIFDNIVIPRLEQHFGGKILSTEKYDQNTESIEKWLDRSCGIDAAVLKPDILFGIAHRVNKDYYRDFTIHMKRKDGHKTEKDHIYQLGIKPRFHIQTVCEDWKPKTIAIIKTTDIRLAIDLGLYTPITNKDGDEFAALWWNVLEDNGLDIDYLEL